MHENFKVIASEREREREKERERKKERKKEKERERERVCIISRSFSLTSYLMGCRAR